MTTTANIFWDRISERAEETVKALRQGRVPDVIRYALHITNCCNMNCKYCNEVKSNKIMDRDQFSNLCAAAGSKGIIHITGGEPMTVPWLEEEILKHKNVRFALNTNMLVLPTKDTLESVFRLKTSLDDTNADRWNETTGGNHFDKVVENIAKATEIVKYSSVCYTATHESASRLPEFIKFCKWNFPKLFSISVSFYKGNNPKLVLDKSDISLLFDAAKLMNPVSKEVFMQTHSKNGNNFPENLNIPCYLSLSERLIDENGTEYFCSHLFRDHVTPPGNPGKDPHCVTGCNQRFSKYNKYVHEQLAKKG